MQLWPLGVCHSAGWIADLCLEQPGDHHHPHDFRDMLDAICLVANPFGTKDVWRDPANIPDPTHATTRLFRRTPVSRLAFFAVHAILY